MEVLVEPSLNQALVHGLAASSPRASMWASSLRHARSARALVTPGGGGRTQGRRYYRPTMATTGGSTRAQGLRCSRPAMATMGDRPEKGEAGDEREWRGQAEKSPAAIGEEEGRAGIGGKAARVSPIATKTSWRWGWLGSMLVGAEDGTRKRRGVKSEASRHWSRGRGTGGS